MGLRFAEQNVWYFNIGALSKFMGLRLAEQTWNISKNVTFVFALNQAHVQALNTAHVLRLNKADVLALNRAHVLRLNTKTTDMPSVHSQHKGGGLRKSEGVLLPN